MKLHMHYTTGIPSAIASITLIGVLSTFVVFMNIT